jgi:glutamate-1-semialdehyde aminotransferase
MILSIGYHGWHPGHIPGYGVSQLPWGDLRQVELAIRSDVAGVLLEPMRDHQPPPGYLEGVAALCKQWGAVFILDEIVTGFRWRIGGATEMFGLDPDIQCFSKAMSNGYRCAAIVGKRAVMEHATGVSSTFGGECLGLAATRATIRVYQEERIIEKLWATGATLMAEMAKAGKPMTGYPVHPRFKTAEIPEGAPWVPLPKDVVELTHLMASRGVLCHPAGLNPMAAHTPEDIQKTVEATQ